MILWLPDWRWDRAIRLVDKFPCVQNIKYGKDEDKLVIRLVRYYHDYTKASMDADALDAKYPDLHLVHQLNTMNQSGSPKHMLEALALTEISDKEISPYVGIPPKLVSLYCDVFFDVRSEANRRLYINKMYSMDHNYTHMELDSIGWKIVAARAGFEKFKRIFLEPEGMSDEEFAWLSLDKAKTAAVASWSLTKTLGTRGDYFARVDTRLAQLSALSGGAGASAKPGEKIAGSLDPNGTLNVIAGSVVGLDKGEAPIEAEESRQL